MNLGEDRPPAGSLVPALHHEGVHAAGAVLWAGQQLAGADHLDDLLVAVAVVGLQQDTALVSSIEDTELRDH